MYRTAKVALARSYKSKGRKRARDHQEQPRITFQRDKRARQGQYFPDFRGGEWLQEWYVRANRLSGLRQEADEKEMDLDQETLSHYLRETGSNLLYELCILSQQCQLRYDRDDCVNEMLVRLEQMPISQEDRAFLAGYVRVPCSGRVEHFEFLLEQLDLTEVADTGYRLHNTLQRMKKNLKPAEYKDSYDLRINSAVNFFNEYR